MQNKISKTNMNTIYKKTALSNVKHSFRSKSARHQLPKTPKATQHDLLLVSFKVLAQFHNHK